MTFNLHCHLHLPSQVSRNGPLHLINSFPFEGYFFNAKSFANGTRNLACQIARKVELYKKINFDKETFINCKKELQGFANKLIFKLLNHKIYLM